MKSKTSDSLKLFEKFVVDCPDRCVSQLHKYSRTSVSVSVATFKSLFYDVKYFVSFVRIPHISRVYSMKLYFSVCPEQPSYQ